MRKRQPRCERSPGSSRTLVAVVLVAALLPATSAAAAPIVATWRATPLAEVAAALGPLLGRPVVVDRRIDPTTPVTLVADGRDAGEVLAELARLSGSEVVVLRESVRLAVPGSRSPLQAAEEARGSELQQATADVRRLLSSRSPAAWPAGSSPGPLISAMAAENGLTIRGLDRLPHDHLRSQSLPPTSLAATLDLLLAGFDLRATITGTGLEVVPIDPQGVPRRPPQLPAGSRSQPAGSPPATRFTLEAAAPLEELLTAVATQTGLTLRLDAARLKELGIDPATVVRVQVADVTRDQLLDRLTAPVGLSWTIDGTTLVVTARSSPSEARRADDERPRD